MSDWDAYQKVDARSEIAVAAEEFMRLSQQQEKIQERLDVLEDALAANFHEEAGEAVVRIGDEMVLICNRPERWSWDTPTLEAILSSQPNLPAHVKRSLTVDKRKFESLDDATKKALLPALTRKPGKAKIKVYEVS